MTAIRKRELTAAEATGLTAVEAEISDRVAKGLIPDPKYADRYVHRDVDGYDDFSVLDVARALRHNVLLLGPTGSAKSFFFNAYGAHHGIPVATVSCNGASDPATWFGSYRPIPNGEGGTDWVWVDGIVTSVLRHGGVIHFDEVGFLRPEISAAVHQVLRERELILLEKGNEVVKAHPDTLIVASTNPDYSGTNELNTALRNRFAITLDWDYNPVVEAQLVSAPALLQLATALRASIVDGALETPCPTNALIEFEELATEFDANFAANVFLNRYNPDERLVVAEHIDLLGIRSLSYGE